MIKHLSCVFGKVLFVLWLTLNSSLNLQAQEGTAPGSTSAPAKTIVRNLTQPELKNFFRVGDRLEMIVIGSHGLATMKARQLLLYINGLPMQGLHPVFHPSISNDSARLTFLLVRSRDSTTTFKAWDRFYRRPRDKGYPIAFSVGSAEKELSPRSGGNTLELVKKNRLWWVWLETAAAAALILLLAKRSNILKEDIQQQNTLYSLARTQIAWWTIIVLGSFLHLYIYTDELIDLSDATMVLLGVSAATLVGAKVIDFYKIYTVDGSSAASSSFISRGFLLDILSDGKGGVSIHRFQFLVWTLALTFVFIRGVIRDLAMPDFPTNLLLLMGISNGTYLLLKLPENTSSTATQAPATTVPSTNQASVNQTTITTPTTVTTEGGVISRQEEDMSDPALSGASVVSNLPSSNQALG